MNQASILKRERELKFFPLSNNRIPERTSVRRKYLVMSTTIEATCEGTAAQLAMTKEDLEGEC